MTEAAPSERPHLWPAAFGGVLFLAMAVASYMGSIVGVLAPFLVEDLAMSRLQLGSLSTVLYVVGAFGSPLAGRLVDHLGGRVTLDLLFFTAAIGVASMALAPSYGWLVASMFFAGLSLAGGNPATNKLVAAHLPVGARGTTIGVKQAGVPIAKLFAGTVLPIAALALGWRGAVILALSLPIVGVIASRAFVPTDDPTSRSGHKSGVAAIDSSVGWLGVYAFLMGSGVSIINTYLPLYAYDAVNLRVTTAGLLSSFVGLMGAAARVAWGRFSHRFRTVSLPLLVIALISMGSILLFIAAAEPWGGAWLLWLAAFLFGVSAFGWVVVGMVGMVERTGSSHTGHASGRVFLCFYGGFIASPLAFGAIVDAAGRYHVAWGFTASVFAAASVTAFAWHLTDRPIDG